MPTLRIPFPDGVKHLALRGSRITIGRLPDNLIQIRDLTISARHAELILEGDHYRIHDLQSTNGVFADGRQVEDFHLLENCKLRLGTVECEFLEKDVETEPTEPVPTHIEMRALKQANGELKAQLEALRVQNENMKSARESTAPENQGTVSLERYDQLATDMAGLLGAQSEQRTQMEALRTQLAVVARERDNLQRAYDEARGALETPPPKPAEQAQSQAATVAPAEPPVAPVVAAPIKPAGVAPAPRPVAPRPPNGAPGGPVTARPPTVPMTAPIQAAPVAAAPAAARVATPAAAARVAPAPAAPAPTGAPKPPVAVPRGSSLLANIRPEVAVARNDGSTPAAPLPKPPGTFAGTPTRRPPSAIQPQPVKPVATAKPAGVGLKETQKLEG